MILSFQNVSFFDHPEAGTCHLDLSLEQKGPEWQEWQGRGSETLGVPPKSPRSWLLLCMRQESL